MLHRLRQNRVARNLTCAALAISAVGGIIVATSSGAQAARLTPNFPSELYCYSQHNKYERIHVEFTGREVWAPEGGVASGGVNYNVTVEYNKKVGGPLSASRRWTSDGNPRALPTIPYQTQHFPASKVCARAGYTGGTAVVKW